MSKIPTDTQWTDLASRINAKQDVLTAGDGIDITNNVVSAFGGTGAYLVTSSAITVTSSIDNKMMTITIPADGVYLVLGLGGAYAISGGSINISFGKNNAVDSDTTQLYQLYDMANARFAVSIANVYTLNANDTVHIYAKNNAGSSVSLRKGFTLAAIRMV